MGRHLSPSRRPGGRVRGSTVGLLAAALTPLATFGLAVPAFAGTSAADAADSAAQQLGLNSIIGLDADVDAALDQGGVAVDADVCADLRLALGRASEAADAAPGNVELAGVVADLQAQIGDQCDDQAPPSSTPPTSTSPSAPTSTSPLPPVLGGTDGGGAPSSEGGGSRGGGAGQDTTSETIPGSAGSGTPGSTGGQVSSVPRGAVDAGDGSFPDAP